MPDSAMDQNMTASTAEILQRIDAVAPIIEGEADASEAQGHLTQKLVDTLHEA